MSQWLFALPLYDQHTNMYFVFLFLISEVFRSISISLCNILSFLGLKGQGCVILSLKVVMLMMPCPDTGTTWNLPLENPQ